MGVAVADYDNDGLPDIYVTATATTRSITILAAASSRMLRNVLTLLEAA
jgi:hypothetical protein